VLAERYLSFSAFNLSGGIAASGEDFGAFSVAGTLFDSLVAGFGVRRRGSVFCGGILPSEDLRSAMV
jgi:hypothetical protein